MARKNMTLFCSLGLSCEEQFPGISSCLRDVMEQDGVNTRVLDPWGWFTDAHSFGSFIWIPPPALVDVAVEQLGKARHKQPECLHLIVLPRLMTGRWRQNLRR